jgi:hypothetical protein
MKTSGTEDPDISPHSHVHIIFNRGTKNIQWRKDSLFNKCCWENLISATLFSIGKSRKNSNVHQQIEKYLIYIKMYIIQHLKKRKFCHILQHG